MSGKFLPVTWDDITLSTLRLARKVVEAHAVPDMLVGILRGGWVVARLLSDYLGVNSVEAVGIRFYKGVGERHERPVITRPLTADVGEKKVLIVDDVADSGKTLQITIELLQLYGPKEVKTASIYVKPTTVIVPDFYVIETDAWIIFPWEYAEVLRNLIKSKGLSLNADSLNYVMREVGLKRNVFIDELLALLSLTANNAGRKP